MTGNSSSVLRHVLILFLSCVIVYFGKDVLMPLVIAIVLATLFLPLCIRIEKMKVPRTLAALICLLLLIVGITAVVGLLGWEISKLTDDIAVIKLRMVNAINKLQEYLFRHVGLSVEWQSQLLKDEQPSLGSIMQKIGGSFSYIITNLVLVLVYVLLLLNYRTHLFQFIIKLAGPSRHEETGTLVNAITLVSQQYLLGLSKMIVCLWIMYSIGFSLLGVKNAFFFAFLCGLLEIVPFIGNITGTTLTVLVAAAQGAGIPMLGGIVLTYGIVQFIQGWVLEPLIVGHQVKINPLFIIIALVLGELVWGIAGIFLAIPLTAMFKTVCDHVEILKPYGFLMGEVENKKREFSLIKKAKKLINRK